MKAFSYVFHVRQLNENELRPGRSSADLLDGLHQHSGRNLRYITNEI